MLQQRKFEKLSFDRPGRSPRGLEPEASVADSQMWLVIMHRHGSLATLTPVWYQFSFEAHA